MKGWSLVVASALLTFLMTSLIISPRTPSVELSRPSVESKSEYDPELHHELQHELDHGLDPERNSERRERVGNDDVDVLRVQAGLTALEGSGVIVEMDDSTHPVKSGENPNLYVIHDDDVLRVINELRAAGAEAISINGQRLIDTSEIRCAGPTLSVNNVRSAAPFIISALGDKVALENSIKMRGGVEQTLSVWGIRIEVKTSDDVYIPPFEGRREFTHAHPTAPKIVSPQK